MAEIIRRDQAHLLSERQVAALFEVSRDTVSRRLRDVRQSGERSGFPVYHMRDVAPAMCGDGRQAVSGDDDFDPLKLPPKDRDHWFASEQKRVKLEADLRGLIPAEDVERVLAAAFKSLSGSLDMLPDVLERECGLSAAAVQQCIKAIDGARQSLYDQLLGLCDTLGTEDAA